MAVLENNHTRNNSQGLLIKMKGNPFYRYEMTPRVKHWNADKTPSSSRKGTPLSFVSILTATRRVLRCSSTEWERHEETRGEVRRGDIFSSLSTSLQADKAVGRSPAQPHPGSQRRVRQSKPLSESNPTGGVTPWVEDFRSLWASLWCGLCRCWWVYAW